MDGSAINFLKVLKNTSIKSLTSKRNYLKIKEKIELIDGEKNFYRT